MEEYVQIHKIVYNLKKIFHFNRNSKIVLNTEISDEN